MFSLDSFFRRSASESVFRGLKVDMHSHLIPGIDDGSPDLLTSVAFIKRLQQLGYEKLVTTPHIMVDLYPNDSTGIRVGLANLTEAITQAGVDIKLEAAAEYFIDRHFDNLLINKDILSFGKKRYVLIEMSFVSISPNLEEAIFALVSQGYQPLLAHPERYTYLINRKNFFMRLKDMGCMMQVNILSLVGYYGKTVQNWALEMLKSEFIDFLGTDLHHQQHLDMLISHQLDRKLINLVAKYPFRNQELL